MNNLKQLPKQKVIFVLLQEQEAARNMIGDCDTVLKTVYKETERSISFQAPLVSI